MGADADLSRWRLKTCATSRRSQTAGVWFSGRVSGITRLPPVARRRTRSCRKCQSRFYLRCPRIRGSCRPLIATCRKCRAHAHPATDSRGCFRNQLFVLEKGIACGPQIPPFEFHPRALPFPSGDRVFCAVILTYNWQRAQQAEPCLLVPKLITTRPRNVSAF